MAVDPDRKLTHPEYEAAVAACPNPSNHTIFRYCPDCPWTEKGPIAGFVGEDAAPALKPSADLKRRFEGISVGADLAEAMDAVRALALHLGTFIEHAVPDSRERSLALTKLEEAVFWANRGIAVHG